MSVNPARKLRLPAIFVGGWALEQLWLFWIAPIVGAAIAGVVYSVFAEAPETVTDQGGYRLNGREQVICAWAMRPRSARRAKMKFPANLYQRIFVDRVTRSKLKQDQFALEVEHSVEYVAEHRKQVIQYSAIAIVVALVAWGIWYYRDRQHTEREEALAAAMDVMQAPVAPNAPAGQLFYTTDALKNAAAEKAFKGIIDKYSGSEESAIASSYLGAVSTDEGKLPDAEKYFKQAADSGSKQIASIGKLSLAQVYLSEGRRDEAEKLLRSLYESPTVLVSKEQAAISLARALSTTKPAETRKLLEPLRTGRSAVSQTAITLLSELPQK